MTFLKTFFLTLFFIPAIANTNLSPQPLNQSVRQFITKLHKQYGFNERYLTETFKKAHYNPRIIANMTHPYEKKPWYRYRQLFITEKKIQQGVDFIELHQKTLQEAEKKYGVPASIIVAIMGIETLYGQHKGDYSVLDSLTTLTFHYPKRAKFFAKELTQYFLLTREQHLSPFQLTGSYAGAIGIPQFMPSAYRHYAVDYSNEGSADLVNNVDDTIFSIANYLKKNGWQTKQPVANRLPLQKVPQDLLSKSATPRRKLSYYRKKGVKIRCKLELKSAIIELPSKDEKNPEHWLTFANFKAIMRYNPRINYAMAVYQLNKAIKDEHQRTHTSASTKPPSKRQPVASLGSLSKNSSGRAR